MPMLQKMLRPPNTVLRFARDQCKTRLTQEGRVVELVKEEQSSSLLRQPPLQAPESALDTPPYTASRAPIRVDRSTRVRADFPLSPGLALINPVSRTTTTNMVGRCRMLPPLDHLLVELENAWLVVGGRAVHVACASSASRHDTLSWTSDDCSCCRAESVGARAEVGRLVALVVACSAATAADEA
jgi:hypothetical protein